MLSGVPKENLFIYLFDLKGIYFVFLFRNISGLAWHVRRLGSNDAMAVSAVERKHGRSNGQVIRSR
jgi:hypothetical protein